MKYYNSELLTACNGSLYRMKRENTVATLLQIQRYQEANKYIRV